MAFDFKKFNEIVDTNGLKEDISNAKSGGGEREEVPFGDYEVKVVKMELKESKNGDPMVSIWFEIVAGEHKGRYLFYNKVLLVNKPVTFHFMHEFLRDMAVETPVEFIEWEQYDNMYKAIFEEIRDTKTYHINYGAGSNPKFTEIKIVEVFTI
jgi:hypothetical protein